MRRVLLWVLILFLGSATCLHVVHARPQQAAAPPAAAAAPASGVRAEYLANLNAAADHAVRLAGAFPAEKYTWRPGEGVRSVSEVFLHIAAANYSYARRLGVALPEGVTLGPDFEKSTTDKAKVTEILKQSIEIARQAATQMAYDADVEKTMQGAGGRQITYRQILFSLASHNHEHLGQLIAYARVNGIVPPWTEEQQQQQRQQQPPKKSP